MQKLKKRLKRLFKQAKKHPQHKKKFFGDFAFSIIFDIFAITK